MKLKKLLKKIDNDTFVSIGFEGECMSTCKLEDIEKKLLERDLKVKAIDAGVVYTIDGTNKQPKINIYCE